jgi:hypothetical protein
MTTNVETLITETLVLRLGIDPAMPDEPTLIKSQVPT